MRSMHKQVHCVLQDAYDACVHKRCSAGVHGPRQVCFATQQVSILAAFGVCAAGLCGQELPEHQHQGEMALLVAACELTF
jgi:hypothetical protein